MELRDREEAQAWVAAGLSLCRLATVKEAHATATPWLLEAVSETGRLPPPGIVIDLGRLFLGHPLRRALPLPGVDPELRAALRSYEDHVLGRLEASSQLDILIDAFASMGNEARARAIAVVVANLIERLGVQAVAVSPGVLRNVVGLTVQDIEASAAAALSPGEVTTAQLLDGYRQLTERSHRVSKLVTDADIFVVSNIDVLADLTQRLAISETLEVSELRRLALPRRIKARRRPKKQEVMTALSDEDHYPTGGFASIATSGTMENLVISELIYMEEPDETAPDSVDLFDLHYAEGELLYYTRDDSQFVRDHRAIGIALCPDLVKARIKDRDALHQRLIELLASLHCTVGRLAEWLSEQALHIAMFTIDERGRDVLSAERGLLEVLFSEEIERGLVSIGRHASLSDTLAGEIGDPRAYPEWLIASSRPLPKGDMLAREAMCRLALGKSLPEFAVGSADAVELASWDQATLELLHRLV